MRSNEKIILDILHTINDEIPDDITVNLLRNGYIDSFDIVNIVSEIEEKLNIELNPEDIIPENFESVEKMEKLISQMIANE